MKYTEKDFTDGMRVKITGNSNSSINKIGDIGILKIYHANPSMGGHVKVEGRRNSCNFTKYYDMEPLEKVQNLNYEIY